MTLQSRLLWLIPILGVAAEEKPTDPERHTGNHNWWGSWSTKEVDQATQFSSPSGKDVMWTDQISITMSRIYIPMEVQSDTEVFEFPSGIY